MSANARNTKSRGTTRFGTPGRRTGNARQATVAHRQPLPRILIVCEGEKTEPGYFLGFHVTDNVFGQGLETLRVVEDAIRRNALDGPFDQIWCVFDRDGFPPADFDNAIGNVRSLESNGFHVAFSNEAFELWYLLHFEYLQSAISRSMYCDKLSAHLGCKYNKSDPNVGILVGEKGSEQDAIRNAEKLLSLHDPGVPYHKCAPMTTVHELVKVLREARRLAGME